LPQQLILGRINLMLRLRQAARSPMSAPGVRS
jgi:hypothetical protein